MKKKASKSKASPKEAPVDDTKALEVEADASVAETPTVPVVPEEDLQKKYDKIVGRMDVVKRAEKNLKKWQNKVAQSTQQKKQSEAQLKSDIGARDKAVIELQRLVDDLGTGQGWLPGMEETPAAGATTVEATSAVLAVGSSENWPISELGVKRLKVICGAEAFDKQKDIDDPIGLSDKQLESLEAAEFATINDLEKKMREDSWWHAKVAKNPQAAIIQRVISSLLAFRKVHPLEEKTPTVLEKLAEQTASEAEKNPETATAA